MDDEMVSGLGAFFIRNGDSDDSVASEEERGDEEYVDELSSSSEVVYESAEAGRIVLPQCKLRGIGFQLWPAARFFCEEVLEHWRPQGTTRILELGAGVGLCGIYLSKALGRDGRCVLTDLDDVLEITRLSVSMNGDCCDVVALPWGQNMEGGAVRACGGGVDAVVAADVVYFKELHEPLLDTLKVLINDYGAVAFIAHTKRWRRDDKFFSSCRKHFEVSVLAERVVHADGERRREVSRLYKIEKH